MSIYQWKGVGANGRRRKGKLEAADERQVENFLKRLRISEYSVKEAPKELVILKPKVKARDVLIFTRQFSTLIDAGLPLVQSLKVLSDQSDNSTFKSTLREINNSVQGGSTLSDSMRKYPKIFDSLYCNLIAAGEAAGILDSILKRLAEYIEKAEKLKRKVKSAMTYPAIILLVAVAVMAILLVYVIPVFEEVFSGFGKDLPALTQVVVQASQILRGNALAVLMGLIVFIIVFVRFHKTKSGSRLIDKALINLPFMGDLVKKVAVAKFSRTLATMLQAGVPIISSLDIVASTAGNRIVEEAIIDSRIAIAEGRSLTDPLLESGIFPSMVTQMIAVGEEAGALDSMLLKVADFYDEEVDAAVETVTSLIEPMLIIFLGITVGTVVIAMYMPIFELGDAVS